MSTSSFLRWLVLGAMAWPAVALAPTLQHAALWTALFAERERGSANEVVATRVPRTIADWIVLSRDNDGLPFIVIDKAAAHLHVFDAEGTFAGATPVLLGAAIGDQSVPGIGERPLGTILPDEKTTPAGRFVAERGRNLKGEDIMWVDYDAAVSLHRVRAAKPEERRLERLATATPLDNRISFGCINVPAKFYDEEVQRAFAGGHAIVYILPETRPAFSVFNRTSVRVAATGSR
jgi:hypothetical protein